ncbi:MAG TPA: STAS/SEC14 domain-containing protein [Longimicrobiales bacterium]|nr:STAS/SEC14 domain-containing protein [Longimicrobiales bacterium]
MPYQITVDEKARTIVITGFGTGTTADTLQLIAETRQLFRAHPGFNMLYDSTDLQIDSSPHDIMKVAEALFDPAHAAFGRIAVVVPETREWLGRIFTALAHPHGIAANVFAHVGDARSWLGIKG